MPFAYESASAVSVPVIRLSVDARSAFLRRTYTHLFLAVAGFVAFELFLFNAGLAFPIARGMLSVPWLLILGAFMVAGWLARSVAASAAAPGAAVRRARRLRRGPGADLPAGAGHRQPADAGRAARRGADHGRRVRGPHRGGLRHAQGLLVHARHPDVGRHPRAGADRRRDALRLRAGRVLLGGDGRLRRRRDPLRHLERPAPLPRGQSASARRSSCSRRSRCSSGTSSGCS